MLKRISKEDGLRPCDSPTAGDSAAPAAEQASIAPRRRQNMLDQQAEPWRPPLFSPNTTGAGRLIAWMRRCLDLQAASIWQNLRCELKSARGLVLDVGCGAQPLRPLLGPRARYIGIDTDRAKADFGHEFPDTVYFSGDVWPVGDGSVDVVLCTETLEHVPDTKQFLSEAARVTRPGGTLLMTVPFAARWHFIPCDYWRFTPSGLRLVLEQAGFEQIVVMARGNAVTVASYKTMALILPLLFSPGKNAATTALRRVLGAALSPFLGLLAAIGQLSLRAAGGNDCLGYTVIAQRKTA